jgi:dihydrolipoamide dehydrogenase
MSEPEVYDLFVIGAGSGGYHAALRASQYGAKVAICEKDKVGGTCLNRGCIPTKALYSTVKLLEDIKEKGASFGINVSGPTIDFAQAVERKNKVVDELVAGIEGLFKQRKVPLYRGHGKIVAKDVEVNGENLFQCSVEGQDNVELYARKVIVATGSTPAQIPAFHIDHQKILDSDDILSPDFKELPKTIVIIGAGVIGCEFANIFALMGVKVIMLEFLPSMLANEEKLVIKELQKVFDELGIEVHVSQNVVSVDATDSGIIATTCDASVPREEVEGAEKSTFEADLCLVSIGRNKVSGGVGLEELGVEIDRGAIKTDPKTLETACPGVYAVGDVTSPIMLAHVAYYGANVAVANALSAIGGFDTEPKECDLSIVPYTIFTSPNIGSVGLREDKAKEKAAKVYTGRFFYGSLGKAKAMGEEKGFMQVTADASNGLILGATCIGAEAPELISEVALAMQNKISAEGIAETIHSHPTISEMVLESVEDVYGMAIHKAARRRK